jgi:hypothetical protein
LTIVVCNMTNKCKHLTLNFAGCKTQIVKMRSEFMWKNQVHLNIKIDYKSTAYMLWTKIMENKHCTTTKPLPLLLQKNNKNSTQSLLNTNACILATYDKLIHDMFQIVKILQEKQFLMYT